MTDVFGRTRGIYAVKADVNRGAQLTRVSAGSSVVTNVSHQCCASDRRPEGRAGGDVWELSVLSAQFSVNPKTA